MVDAREITEIRAVSVVVAVVDLRSILLLGQHLVVDCCLVRCWLAFVVVVWFTFPAEG